MRMLIQAGASLNARDYHGHTVLSHAINKSNGSTDTIRLLLQLNASLLQPRTLPNSFFTIILDRMIRLHPQRLLNLGLDVAEFCIDLYYDFTVGGARYILSSGRQFRQAIIRQIPFNFAYMNCWISDEIVKMIRGRYKNERS